MVRPTEQRPTGDNRVSFLVVECSDVLGPEHLLHAPSEGRSGYRQEKMVIDRKWLQVEKGKLGGVLTRREANERKHMVSK